MALPVTIVIPTFRRPAQLLAVVESVFSQSGLDTIRPRLVIVDNDPEGSALAQASRFRDTAPETVKVEVVHCREAGVASARNAAMERIETPLVAFIDDDQTASPNWLWELLKAHQTFGAAVTFGPVDAVLPEETSQHRDYLEGFFSRRPGHLSGLIKTFYGCGNALLDLRQLPKRDLMFDTRMNEVGGEDDLLFIRAEAAGCKFAWAEDARVFEHVPASRAGLSYTLTRAIGYGQGPTRRAEESGDVPGVLFWMGVGAGQLLFYGTMAGFGWLTGSRQRAVWLNQAAQGLGKVIWRKKFRFYGQSQVTKAAISDQAGGLPAKSQA